MSSRELVAACCLAAAFGWYYIYRNKKADNVGIVEKKEVDSTSAAEKHHLRIFHCGEQPIIAEQLRQAALSKLGPDVTVETLDKFQGWINSMAIADNSSTMRMPPCLLVVTTGEECELTGLPAVECLKFLARKTNSANTLRGIRFAVLGLGDSNHLATSHRSISWASGKDCNQGGELFDRWLEQLGGTRIVRRGESDARTDHDALEPWTAALWTALR